MTPILALNCLLQIEQERSEEESFVGDALALALKKLEGHIASGTFVRACIRPSIRPFVRYAFLCIA